MQFRQWNLSSVCATVLLALLAPVLVAQSKPAAKPTTGGATTGGTQTRQVTAAKSTTGEPLDLNTATPDQLKSLPGIGDAYAKRIVDGRPYTMKNQIVQRGIVPQAAYDKIKDGIIAHRVKK